jgi:hypothetical protein
MSCFTFVIAAAFLIPIGQAAGPPASQPSAHRPAVRVTTIDGKALEGTWVGVGAKGEIQIESSDARPTILTQAEVMSVHFGAPTSQPASEKELTFFLNDGSHVRAGLISGGSRQLELATNVTQMTVPVASVAAIRFAPATLEEPEAAFRKALLDRAASEDLLIAVNNGRVTSVRGVVEEITPQGGSFRWRQRSIAIRPETTYAVVMARGVSGSDRAPVMLHLRYWDDVWGGELVASEPGKLVLKTTGGTLVRFPLDTAAELRFRSDRVQFVSDLEPAEYVFEPFGATRWPYRRDRSVANVPLQMDGRRFDRGLGMHSQSRLVYHLPDRYTQLAGTIGIDDRVRPRGSVVFRVLADGKGSSPAARSAEAIRRGRFW